MERWRREEKRRKEKEINMHYPSYLYGTDPPFGHKILMNLGNYIFYNYSINYNLLYVIIQI